MTKRRWKWGTPLAVALTAFAVLGNSAGADPASQLSVAESRVSNAQGEVAAAQRRLEAVRADYAAASRRAGPRAEAARAAQTRAQELRDRLLIRHRRAKAEVTSLEASHRQEEDDHDEEVTNGLGFGLAALIAAVIALGWGWFRATAAVAALARMPLGKAVALCLGGGFLVVVVGAALAEGEGLAAVLGFAIVFIGLLLPIALLLARHFAEVQRGRAKPMLGRRRLPDWVPRAAALLLLLLGLGSLIGAISVEEPESPAVTAQLRESARPVERGPSADRLKKAETEAVETRTKAAAPLAQERAARAALRTAASGLRRAKARLVNAQADERRFASRLAALVEREEREDAKAEREAARAEREAQRQAEREAEEAEFEEFEEDGGGGCDPNYSGCVPIYPPDVDCAEVGGSVSSYGTDPHGLDADSDGIGCE